MRQNCKFFESRTYPSGDTVRKCDLDLAPEAPWRCPDNCEKFEARLVDVAWQHGSLITPPTPPEPEGLGSDDSIAALLGEAQDILHAAGPGIVADVEAERKAQAAREANVGRLGKIRRRFRRKKR